MQTVSIKNYRAWKHRNQGALGYMKRGSPRNIAVGLPLCAWNLECHDYNKSSFQIIDFQRYSYKIGISLIANACEEVQHYISPDTGRPTYAKPGLTHPCQHREAPVNRYHVCKATLLLH